MEALFKTSAKKRYYLHSKVRNEGFQLDAHKRTIYVSHEDFITESIFLLRDKYGYNVQIEIPYVD
jgi:ribosomal protein S10